MHWWLASAILPGLVAATVPDNTQPFGDNPIKKFSAQWLGNITADNSCSHRDLGFTGSISGKWFAIYGDTLWCKQGISDPNQDTDGQYHGIARDSVSAVTSNPLKVHDLHLNNDSPVPHQLQFVPYNPSWGEDSSYGFGGTSLVEVDGTKGIGALYYLVNADDKYLKGAGIARVDLVNGVPTVTHRYSQGSNQGFWWPYENNARYGDKAAYRDVNSEYIYLLGGVPGSAAKDWISQAYVYQARVKASDAFNLGAYQYWWGRSQGWKSDLLTKFDTESAVMWGADQGQMVYSKFFGCYIFVHIGGNKVQLRTSKLPEGPWSADVAVYTIKTLSGGLAYSGVAHPYFDDTGRTLVVSYTNMPNVIEAVKLTFSL